MGVTSPSASAFKSAGTLLRPGEEYGSKMPAVLARPSRTLSTPKATSPSGLLLERMRPVSIAPASPLGTSLTVTWLSVSNCLSRLAVMLYESWVMTVSVALLLPPPQADAASARKTAPSTATKGSIRFHMGGTLSAVRGAEWAIGHKKEPGKPDS